MTFFHRVLRWIQYLGDMSWWETQWNYWGNSSIWGTLKCVIPFLTELPKNYWFYYPHIFDSKKFKALLYFPQIRFISSMTELINSLVRTMGLGSSKLTNSSSGLRKCSVHLHPHLGSWLCWWEKQAQTHLLCWVFGCFSFSHLNKPLPMHTDFHTSVYKYSYVTTLWPKLMITGCFVLACHSN